MSIEIFNKYQIIEWILNYWINGKLLNKYEIIQWI